MIANDIIKSTILLDACHKLNDEVALLVNIGNCKVEIKKNNTVVIL